MYFSTVYNKITFREKKIPYGYPILFFLKYTELRFGVGSESQNVRSKLITGQV